MGDVMTEFASKYETLLLRRERSRLYVTLNRPQVKNALNPTRWPVPFTKLAHPAQKIGFFSGLGRPRLILLRI